jgi:PST family polysaccharide transporter
MAARRAGGPTGAAGPDSTAGPDSADGSVPPAGPGRVRAAIAWSYLLTAGRAGSSIIVTFLLAKLLGPSEFGLVAMATAYILIAQAVIQHGLVAALVQRERVTDDHLDAAFWVLLLGGLGCTALTAAAGPLWALLNRQPELTVLCVALSPLVLLQALAIVPESILRRELRFRSVALRTLAAALLSGAVGVGLALAGAGIWALVAQQLVNAAVSLVVLWLVCPWRPGRRLRLRGIRDLWAFSAHSASAGIGVLLSARADIILAGIFFGPVATGIYRLAARLPDMLVDVTVRSIQQVALPSLSRLQGDRAGFAAHLRQLQHLGAVAGLPALGVLAATADPLVALLGPQWAGTELPLRLLCLYGAVNVYGVLLGPALQAIGRPGRLAAIAWLRGALGVAALAGVGAGLAGSGDPPGQAAAVALAGIAIQAVVTWISLRAAVHRAAGAPVLRFLAPTAPAALAAIAAALVPLAAGRLGLAGADPVVELPVLGAAATLAAATVLWLADRPLRRQLLARLPGRRPAAPATTGPAATGPATTGPATAEPATAGPATAGPAAVSVTDRAAG